MLRMRPLGASTTDDASTGRTTDEDGAEAKFLGVSKPQPCQSTGGVPVAAAASSVQTAPARNAVLDEWVRGPFAVFATHDDGVASRTTSEAAEKYGMSVRYWCLLAHLHGAMLQGDDVIAEPPAAKKPRVAAQVDPTTAEAYWCVRCNRYHHPAADPHRCPLSVPWR
jgi:hypothetical protein